MKVLFVHNNFPAQFGFLAESMAQDGHACVAIASSERKEAGAVPVLAWQGRRGSTPDIFPAATRAEADLIRAQAAAECANQLKRRGFTPDVIVGHPGWGETLLMREVFPHARQVLYGEFYYRVHGADVNFDPEFGAADPLIVHGKNATGALALAEADRIVCPTPFQASLFPAVLQSRITVIHEGVDTERIQPNPRASIAVAGGRVLDGTRPVITYVSRRLEPLRGFHVFLRALPKVLASTDAEVLVIGDPGGAGYGPPPPPGRTWADVLFSELGDKLDRRRVHLTGPMAHGGMLAALAISAAHVYYTYPFVLSWSLLEAMASECLIIASDTAPVRDVLRDGVNGRLLGFFDGQALSDELIRACRTPTAYDKLRKAARQTVLEHFDRKRTCLPQWRRLLEQVSLESRSPGSFSTGAGET